jgi:predicted enzyme related to lactoylglutathione lyase
VRNAIQHVELSTTDVGRAKKFYTSLFDWTLRDVSEMDYTLFKAGENSGGGMYENKDARSHWIPYVDVDDINASLEKAKSLGATVLKGPAEVPGQGWYCVLEDPTGAKFAMWQSAGA